MTQHLHACLVAVAPVAAKSGYNPSQGLQSCHHALLVCFVPAVLPPADTDSS
jgi:hypothetical protein